MRISVALVLAVVVGSAALRADAASSTMSVSVTVVRACSVSTPETAGAVSMTCTNGVNRVNLGASASDVRALAAGSNTLTVSPIDARTGVVTINF